MNILAVVTPPSIYRGWFTRKTFWEGKFTGEGNFTPGKFTTVNMKNCGRLNVRKHREIKGSDRYVTLDISLKFDSLDKMIMISSESKVNLGRLRKYLITSLGLKSKTRPNKYKNSRYTIVNNRLRSAFQISLDSLKNYLMTVIIGRVPNMSLLAVTFA